VVPAIEIIDQRITDHHKERASAALRLVIDELFGHGDLVDELVAATGGLKVPREDIVKALVNNPPEQWSTTVDRRVDKLLGGDLSKGAKVIVKRVAKEIGNK
jgi:hypothetical protein